MVGRPQLHFTLVPFADNLQETMIQGAEARCGAKKKKSGKTQNVFELICMYKCVYSMFVQSMYLSVHPTYLAVE